MRIDFFAAENPIKISELPQLLESLNVGEVIKAKVLEITSGEALLKLFDGSSVKASIPDDLEIENGQTLALTVTAKSEGKIFLETVKTPVDYAATVVEELKKADGIPVKFAVDTAAELSANGLKVSREAVQDVRSLLKEFPEIDIQKAIFMIKNNQNVTEKSIASLNRLTNVKTSIAPRLEELEQMILKAEDLHSLENLASSMQKSDISNSISNQTNTKAKTYTDGQNKQIIAEDITPDEFSSAVLKDTSVPIMISKLVKLAEMQNKNLYAENISKNEDYEYVLSSVKKLLPDAVKENAPQIVKQVINQISKDLNNVNDNLKFSEGIKDNDIIKAANAIKADNGIKINDEYITKAIVKLAARMEAAVTKVKKEFESLNIKLESGEIKLEVEVKKVFKDIYEKLESVKNSTDTAQSSGREIYTKAENIQNDIKFMNDIYKYSTYLQLPINISQKQMSGELYILKKSRGKGRTAGDCSTVFISLDTPSLGRFESLAELKNRNVTLNVRLENEDSLSYFKENFKALYSSLKDKGYRISDIRYKLIESPINLLNAQKELIHSTGGKSIDLKV